ncbi:hypothetical protein A2V49_01965 [candidate division WWE3 bacterium RBG_19FT_COMBO_34_6]|uniref:DUF4430 domain-containing protein n=1 Tax=candidate division WWE3 bacterium RBG_19FT_COMBO_34_6 TaxID=1802612 RepID=A0A1F4UMB4_UNCKA|nr:MAG: hypothetical protein A2V49_01965 [candidate division WWE3 bacterium RBG_19FT_COMBO_34_6]
MKILILFKKYFPFIYIIFLISSFFYIKHILKIDSISIKDKEITEELKEVEVKPVDVKLIIEVNNLKSIYEKRLNNLNTLDDFLEDLVEDKKLYYEKTEYVYGVEYDLINRQKAPDGYIWRIFRNDEEITYKTKDLKLQDKDIFKIILSKKD